MGWFGGIVGKPSATTMTVLETLTWHLGFLSSFAELSGFLEKYVAEKENFRADWVAAAARSANGRPASEAAVWSLGRCCLELFLLAPGLAAVAESWTFVEHSS